MIVETTTEAKRQSYNPELPRSATNYPYKDKENKKKRKITEKERHFLLSKFEDDLNNFLEGWKPLVQGWATIKEGAGYNYQQDYVQVIVDVDIITSGFLNIEFHTNQAVRSFIKAMRKRWVNFQYKHGKFYGANGLRIYQYYKLPE